MRDNMKVSLKAVMRNWSALLCFEIMHKYIWASIVLNVLDIIMNGVMSVSGIYLISQENIAVVLSRPMAILLLLLALTIIAFCVFFEITALMICSEAGWKNERITVWRLWKDTVISVCRNLRFRNLLVLLALVPAVMLSMLPFTNGVLNGIRLPEFIMEFIYGSPITIVLYALIIAGINVLMLFYMFALPFASLEKNSFASAWKKGNELMRGNKIKSVLHLISCLIAFSAVAICIWALAVGVIAAYLKIGVLPENGRSAFRLYYMKLSGILTVTLGVFISAWLSANVIVMWHNFRGDVRPAHVKNLRNKRSVAGRFVTVITTVVLIILFSETEAGGNLIYPMTVNTHIVAHRAGAAFAPENTVIALENAIEGYAGMAEIDIRETSDGELVVIHDSNFKRTTGLDRRVSDTDYNTVRSLDAGSSFSAKFAGEPVPSLNDMLMAAKGRIELMIELKDSNSKGSMERKTVDAIRKYGMEDECIIASMSMDVLKRAKEIAPEIRTVFITSILYVSMYDADYVDGYSVETSYLTYAMVSQAHFQDKEVYAWTANTEYSIRKILRMEADGIITDNPDLALYCLTTLNEDYLLDALTDLFFPTEE